MIVWDGEEVHDRPVDGCWADLDGRPCSAPADQGGLCAPCGFRLRDERPSIPALLHGTEFDGMFRPDLRLTRVDTRPNT